MAAKITARIRPSTVVTMPLAAPTRRRVKLASWGPYCFAKAGKLFDAWVHPALIFGPTMGIPSRLAGGGGIFAVPSLSDETKAGTDAAALMDAIAVGIRITSVSATPMVTADQRLLIRRAVSRRWRG